MRSQSGCCAFALAMLAPAFAFGEASEIRAAGGLALRWLDPAGLAPDTRGEFESQLAQRLGRPPFDTEGSPQQVLAVSWEGSAERCQVELQLLRGEEVRGTRRLESPTGDCKSLGSALLTVSALLIEAVELESPTEPAPPPSQPPTAALTLSPTPSKPQPTAPARRYFLLASLGAELSAGLAPRLAMGPSASISFAPNRYVRVGAHATYYLPQMHGARPRFELAHSAVGVFACGMPFAGVLAVGACARGSAHRFASTGVSLPHPESAEIFAGSVGVSMRAEWRFARRFAWVGDAGVDALVRPLFFYFQPAAGGERTVFSQRQPSPRWFLGLTLELP